MKWKIRDIEIENQIVIAPMAGISNYAFRKICKEFKAGLIYTEMVSDKALLFDNEKTKAMTIVNEDELPITLQLFGSEKTSLLLAAKWLDRNSNCSIIDINMGCPAPKIVKNDAGSALLKNINLAKKIVGEIVANVSKPVTVKMRIGWDEQHINCVEMAKAMEEVGVSAIALHARTRKQMYEGKANWDWIKKVKEAVSIPVIGNGDITSPKLAKEMLEQTNCDAVMIGRGVLGNPWLILETLYYLEGKDYQLVNKKRFDIARDHAKELIALKGEEIGMKEMRGHGAWYLKGLPHSHGVKAQISKMTTYQEFDTILLNYSEQLAKEDYE